MTTREYTDKEILFSLIIPVYNSSKTIIETLSSVVNQSYDYKKYEVVIINDGSIDDSIQVINNFIEENKKINIKLIDKNNEGVSKARNIGVKNSKGKYIVFIDSDDILLLNYFKYLENSFDSDYDVYFFKNKSFSNRIDSIRNEQNYELRKVNSDQFVKDFYNQKLNVGIWSFMISREFIFKNNLFFLESIRYSEDVEYIYRLISKTKKVLFINNFLYGYRINNDSVMSKFNARRYDSLKIVNSVIINTKDFSISTKIKKYFEARISWSILWQLAATKNYRYFKSESKINIKKKLILKLISFPNLLIIISSLLYVVSKRSYFIFINLYLFIIKNKRLFKIDNS